MINALSSLRPIETFYVICITVGGILFLMRTLLFFIGGGMDGDVDADLDGDFDMDLDVDVDDVDMDTDDFSDPGMKLVSLQSITGFFLMFGLVGLALVNFGIADIITALGGIVAGLFTMFVMAWIVLKMQNLQSSGTLKMENAVGKEGKVYLSIPAEGTGKVNVVVQGGLREFEAVSANQERISTGETVRVVKIISNRVLVVEKI